MQPQIAIETKAINLLLLCAFPFHPISSRRHGVHQGLCPNIQLQTAQPGLHQHPGPSVSTAAINLFFHLLILGHVSSDYHVHLPPLSLGMTQVCCAHPHGTPKYLPQELLSLGLLAWGTARAKFGWPQSLYFSGLGWCLYF